MSRAKIFLRRRYSQLDGSTVPESVERSALASGSFSEIRSPFSIAGQGLGQQKDRLASPRSTAYTDYDKAESVTKSMSYKWFGGEIENTFQNSTTAGTNVASWLEKHTTTIQSVQESDSEPTLGGQISYQNPADSVASTQGKKKWDNVWALGIIAALLIALIGSLGLYLVSGRGIYSKPVRNRLQFRELFFKAVLFDDGTNGRWSDLEQGLSDAAYSLRVNVTIDKTDDQSAALLLFRDAKVSLYDGIILYSSNSAEYMDDIRNGDDGNEIAVITGHEGFSELKLKSVLHVGDQEIQVGRLSGEKMRIDGMKTALCLSHSDNKDSEHRCEGFKEAFGQNTYDLSLKTTMQSELKSKLIPVILDTQEIDALFVADSRSFGLVYQILKSLNRLCVKQNSRTSGHCIYFAAYGSNPKILQTLKRRELQFTIDPQEYLRGYIATALLTLKSMGQKAPSDSTELLLLSRLVSSAKDASDLLQNNRCRMNLPGRFKVYLIGNKSSNNDIGKFKRGLRNAARDFNVDVQFYRYVKDTVELEGLSSGVDGIALSVEDNDLFRSSILQNIDFQGWSSLYGLKSERRVNLDRPVVTFGAYQPSVYNRIGSKMHVGYMQKPEYCISIPDYHELLNRNHMEMVGSARASEMEENPFLQGYLSILFLTIGHRCHYIPNGIFQTALSSVD